MSFDFALERTLRLRAPELHRIFSANVLCCQNILHKYKSLFPAYTDHTSLHSLEVISFCNELIGHFLDRLNCDEIFVLLMAAYLHDSGMGISRSDYEAFSREIPDVTAYRREHPDAPIDEVVRVFHHDFSGKFIEKYQMLFDFPSETHLWATIQTSRGHRKTDLYDPREYPAELSLPNGNVIHLPYLAALCRITDELDVAADRNIQFMYDINRIDNPVSRMEFEKHMAIKKVVCYESHIQILVDFSNEKIRGLLFEGLSKLNDTLIRCGDVVAKRTPFEITQKRIRVFDHLTKEEVSIDGGIAEAVQ